MKILYIVLVYIFLAEFSYSADYYSITSGNWNTPSSWSNVSHTGPASNGFPNNADDRVFIDLGHRIDFTFPVTIVGSVEINNGYLNIGFGGNKKIVVTDKIVVRENGNLRKIIGTSAEGNDTLELYGNFENYSGGKNIVSLYGDQNNKALLKFAGNKSSSIIGEGAWAVSDVEINKQTGKQDTVTNMSNSFSQALSDRITAYSGFLTIKSGIYHHNNSSVLYLTSDDSDDFIIGANGGINLSAGELWTRVGLTMEDNSSINISGGIFIVGISEGQNLLYGTNSILKISGGELQVAGSFANDKVNSTVRFDMSGGRMYVLKHGAGVSNIKPGFSLTSNSVLMWNFDDNPNMDMSRIVIARQHGGNALSYSVQTNNTQVTGGNLQFGEEGANLSAKFQPFTINSLAPVWNLEISNSKISDTLYSSLLLMSAQLQVLNDLIISENGAFDLNCNSLIIQGDLKNMGMFTPDGAGNNTAGEKKVTFSGTLGQAIDITKPIVNSQAANSVNNEPFINVEINKTDGALVLGSGANSNLIIRNNLVFASSNTVSIDARSNDKYVEISPRDGSNDLGTVTRTGKGHVDGKLRLPASNSVASLTFLVGGGDDYTPARLDFSGEGGAAGKIEVSSTPQDPLNLSENGLNIDLDKNVKRYWTVQPVDNFSLGARKFDITLQFVNPKDIRNGADWNKFRQFTASQTPYTMLPAGLKSNILNQSAGNTSFGDYFIAEEPVQAALVKGSVINKKSQAPIPDASVGFINLSTQEVTSVNTDNSGNYQISLDKGQSYIVKAWLDKEYITQYYNGTQNFSEAEPVTASDGLTIDFQLKPVPGFDNFISGKVIDKTGFGTDAYVIGFLKSSDNYDVTDKYEPRTIEALTTEGNFFFENLSPGKYILLAIPASSGLVPGYYLKNDYSVLSWLDATEIVMEADTKLFSTVIKLQDVTSATGPGKISGIVIGEELKMILKDEDSPMAKKQVSGAMTFTVDENDKVRKYDFSEKGGGYTMPGLPNGDYSIGVDKVGYKFYEEGFGIDNSTTNVDKDVELLPYEETSVEETGSLKPLIIYPNPAEDYVYIRYESLSQLSTVRILDLQGREYIEFGLDNNTKDNYKIGLGILSKGIYLIQIIDGENTYTGRLTVL